MGALGERLHRAWHSPRSGPVILFVVGLPVLLALVILAVFPFVVAVDLFRALFSPGHVAFARMSTLYLAYGIGGWTIALLLGVQLARIHRANRGLQADFDVKLTGRIRSAYRLAARLGTAMEGEGLRVSDAIKEDYGAGVWLLTSTDRFWLAVSTIEDSDEAAITLAYDPALSLRARLTRRADRAAFAALTAKLRAILAADPAVTLQSD